MFNIKFTTSEYFQLKIYVNTLISEQNFDIKINKALKIF
jgi:hypothetical protein